MSLPPNVEVINKFNLTDSHSGGPLTSVIVGVFPKEGRQYTPLDVLWLIESTERCRREEDIPGWDDILVALLHNSAVGIFERFSTTKNPKDLDVVITLHRKIVAATDPGHHDYPTRVSNLASFIEDRYKHFHNVDDLDHVVNLLRMILFERMDFDLDSWYYGYLADILVTRYDISRTEEDAEEVLALRRRVFEVTPMLPVMDYVKAMKGFSQAMAEVFRIRQDGTMMNQAIQLQRLVIAFSLSDPDDTNLQDNQRDLAEFMFARFGTSSQQEGDIEEMVEIYEQLLQHDRLCRSGPHAGSIHSHLSAVLNERFRRIGRIDDLDRAISIQLEALEIQGGQHRMRHTSLVLLGYMLRSKFIYDGQTDALDRAIKCLREALELVPHPHDDRPMVLNNLSIVLRRSFEEYNEYHFLLEAMELEEEALKLPPTTTENRLASLSNMAGLMWVRYHRTGGELKELEAITALYEDALALMTDKHPSYPFICGNLGTILGILLDNKPDANEDDLERPMNLIRLCLSGFDESHEENCTVSGNLGVACFRMYKVTRNPDQLEEGIQSFRHAANHPSAATSQRFRAAKAWAASAEEIGDPSALEAYRTVIQMLPELVTVNADLESRQQRLRSGVTNTNDIGLAAASHALRAGIVEDGVEFLEQGRSLFWSQALKLRTPLSDLIQSHPDLAERFQKIGRQLEKGSFQTRQTEVDATSTPNEIAALMASHEDSLSLGHLKTEWDTVLSEIRQQQGFEKFLLPGSISSTIRQLEHRLDGPVIMLCITRKISGAIIISGNGMEYLTLPLTFVELSSLVKILNVVSVSGRSERPDPPDETAYPTLEDLYDEYFRLETSIFVLEELWTKISEPLVQFLKLETSTPPLRVYWCLTGQATFLPIHAAGVYERDHRDRTDSLMDYMVSSYIPTLDALRNILQNEDEEENNINLGRDFLTIVQPQTLPSALEEMQKIEKLYTAHPQAYSNLSLKKLGESPSNPATISSVLDHLSNASIVHFACHGKQVSKNPLESGLILEDGKLTISRIMQVEIKHARLAFLCACETAMGEKELPDESMHLGAALLFTGFQGVVATMWSIADVDGPNVAEVFYESLMTKRMGKQQEGQAFLNTKRGARALHEAVMKLRSDGVPLERWAPFIYLGR